ncbi:hypothetical protein KCP78_13935 [Salmonella enterica subsp. enterica]|nr:hypothetical protein KCP78_13935 [Salmonella enterica subsp. enterica]
MSAYAYARRDTEPLRRTSADTIHKRFYDAKKILMTRQWCRYPAAAGRRRNGKKGDTVGMLLTKN